VIGGWPRGCTTHGSRSAAPSTSSISTSNPTSTASSSRIWRLLPLADRDAAGAFFHVVTTRYEKQHPTIVTTNRGLPDWGQIFGDPVVAAAILDRLMQQRRGLQHQGPRGGCANTRRWPQRRPERTPRLRLQPALHLTLGSRGGSVFLQSTAMSDLFEPDVLAPLLRQRSWNARARNRSPRTIETYTDRVGRLGLVQSAGLPGSSTM